MKIKDNNNEVFDVAIIGGGPSGSTVAIYLSRHKIRTCLIEKKKFPRETLCGEFLSKEVTDILSGLDLTESLRSLNPNPISSITFSFKDEKPVRSNLGFTGYALTRGKFDNLLINEASCSGAVLVQPYEVKTIEYSDGLYRLNCISKEAPEQNFTITAKKVLGAYGKQNHLDKNLGRNFTAKKSHLNGIKIHMPSRFLTKFDCREIHLYSSDQIYCGINAVGDETVTLCFLEKRKPGGQRLSGLRDLMESNSSFRKLLVDPSVMDIIDKLPYYGVGNIYFGRRDLVENGIIMLGDAARVIAPLAGDGIAIAMQSAKIISDIIIEKEKGICSPPVEELYIERWNMAFRRRLFAAGAIQKFLLNGYYNRFTPILRVMFPYILGRLVKLTRSY